MKAREKIPLLFLSANLCRSGFIPPALRARKPVTKAPTTKGARSSEPGAENQRRKKTKCAFPRRLNRKPSPRPRPRLSTVCPALALPGLPLPRRLRFAPPLPATVCPSLAGASPASVPLSPSRPRSVGSFLRRSPPSAGRVSPRSAGRVSPRSAGRVSPVLGGAGLPSFSRGRGRGLGFRALCVAGSAVRSGALPSPLIPLETTQTFMFEGFLMVTQKETNCSVLVPGLMCAPGILCPPPQPPPPPPARFALCVLRSSPLLPLPPPGFAPLRLLRPASPAFALCPPTLGAGKND
jgi:hypothetical protein